MKNLPRSAAVWRSVVFALVVSCAAWQIPQAIAQTFSVVHSFTGAKDGADPLNGFVADAAGNLYGTASLGGTGRGLVYKIDGSGLETVLYKFKGSSDGFGPHGYLIADGAGNLYGTTAAGGAHSQGTVFKLTGTGETILYSFLGKGDGADPEAGLAMDKAGNLYGTTAGGGTSNNGTVFKLAPPAKQGGAWTESVLYSFGTGTDAQIPVGGVTLDSAGNVYGTASLGGAYGEGAVFELKPGTPWTEEILHNFQNAADGSVPYAGLIADGKGDFYGAATQGGTAGGGTIFELTPAGGGWNFNVVYSVPGWGISGSFRNVVLDAASGKLYGTTHCDGDYNSGTVYALTPAGGSWNYSLLYTFTGGSDGQYSYSNLVLSGGKLFGTTKYGGAKNKGVVFSVTP